MSGIGHAEDVPVRRSRRCRAAAGPIGTGLPFVIVIVTPRAMTSMPRVMMNGCRRPFVMPSPFSAPTSAPAASAASTASGQTTPRGHERGAALIAAKPTIDPTDRSIPAVRMTNVMPTPMIPTMDAWRATLARLLIVRKAGDSKRSDDDEHEQGDAGCPIRRAATGPRRPSSVPRCHPARRWPLPSVVSGRAYLAVQPPSTMSVVPVTSAEAGDAR